MTSKNKPAANHPASLPESDPRQWRIRSETGDTFGPADMATLQAWALDGRLAPSHQLSHDDHNWDAVTTVPELEMNWIAEVTPGIFYGPIHKNALTELIREGSISAAAPRFQRSTFLPQLPSEHEQQMAGQLRELQQQLSSRIAELESQRTAARGELEQARAALGARDLEFEAERQEHKAALARLQAELLKRDGRIAALEADLPRLEQLTQERLTWEVRLSDAAQLTADHARQTAQQREELEQACNVQRETDRTIAQLKERLCRSDHDTAALRESVRSLQLRLCSARKLLQQASAALGELDLATDIEILHPSPSLTGTAQNGPPPLATPAGSMKPGLSLTDLEAQAQRELRRLGHKGSTLFKGRAKG